MLEKTIINTFPLLLALKLIIQVCLNILFSFLI